MPRLPDMSRLPFAINYGCSRRSAPIRYGTRISEAGARRIVLAARPEGRPKDSAFRPERIPVPTSGPDQLLLRMIENVLVAETARIGLLSKHPAVKAGIVEIRPAEDLTEMIRESERRRSTTKGKQT